MRIKKRNGKQQTINQSKQGTNDTILLRASEAGSFAAINTSSNIKKKEKMDLVFLFVVILVSFFFFFFFGFSDESHPSEVAVQMHRGAD